MPSTLRANRLCPKPRNQGCPLAPTRTLAQHSDPKHSAASWAAVCRLGPLAKATSFPVASASAPMAAAADHVDHICQLTGNCDHVAIGSDLDGGFGREMAPIDYDTIADLQRFLSILDRRGYAQGDIAAIAHGNLLRFFRQAWS